MANDWRDLHGRFLAALEQPLCDEEAWRQMWRLLLTHPWFTHELHEAARFTVIKYRAPLDLVEDVAQDAPLLLARDLRRQIDLGFDRARGASVFPRWLRTIISHQCRESLRRLRRDRDRHGSLIEEYTIPDCTDAVDLQLDLYRLIDSLGKRERSIVLLYAQGWSLAQIAIDLDQPYQTIYSVWRRAMARLREQFGNDFTGCKIAKSHPAFAVRQKIERRRA